jgi:hypothetical protein
MKALAQSSAKSVPRKYMAGTARPKAIKQTCQRVPRNHPNLDFIKPAVHKITNAKTPPAITTAELW